ncbi:MAG: response regulator [Deltaproteobacteria bacterium]|jgi:DNA-binding NtrC family response regulator|nr:response regulator [Deltaproteobacteria bacterium]MBT6434439.1 response regulator [Deltaproteobacteria bacterium]MBT6489626.1 response regulator [Deltaproteobacteria bacterium]
MHCSDYKILIVDDSRNIRKVFRDILEKVGYQVFEAEGGTDAIKFLAADTVHLILLDMVMPEMNGPRFLSHLRQMKNETPVILITGVTQTQALAECMQFGVREMVVKPTTPENLCEKVSKELHFNEPEGTFEDEGEDQGDYHLCLLYSDKLEVNQMLEALVPGNVSVEQCPDRNTLDATFEVAEFGSIIVDAQTAGKALNRIAVISRDIQTETPLYVIFDGNENEPGHQAVKNGYDGYLKLPLDREQLNRLFSSNLEHRKLCTVDDFVLKVETGLPGQELTENYRTELLKQLEDGIKHIEDQHFDYVVLCFDNAPHPASLLNCIVSAQRAAKDLGLAFALAGSSELKDKLRHFDQTRQIPFFPSVKDAVVTMENELG